jgi:hypothetical protein
MATSAAPGGTGYQIIELRPETPERSLRSIIKSPEKGASRMPVISGPERARADAHRQVLRQSYYLLAWLITTVVVARIMGMWAIIPGTIALRGVSLWLISLSRMSRLREWN